MSNGGISVVKDLENLIVDYRLMLEVPGGLPFYVSALRNDSMDMAFQGYLVKMCQADGVERHLE